MLIDERLQIGAAYWKRIWFLHVWVWAHVSPFMGLRSGNVGRHGEVDGELCEVG